MSPTVKAKLARLAFGAAYAAGAGAVSYLAGEANLSPETLKLLLGLASFFGFTALGLHKPGVDVFIPSGYLSSHGPNR